MLLFDRVNFTSQTQTLDRKNSRKVGEDLNLTENLSPLKLDDVFLDQVYMIFLLPVQLSEYFCARFNLPLQLDTSFLEKLLHHKLPTLYYVDFIGAIILVVDEVIFFVAECLWEVV